MTVSYSVKERKMYLKHKVLKGIAYSYLLKPLNKSTLRVKSVKIWYNRKRIVTIKDIRLKDKERS